MATCVVQVYPDVLSRPSKQLHELNDKEYVYNIPDDVLINVLLEKMDARDLCQLAAVSQRFKSIAVSLVYLQYAFHVVWTLLSNERIVHASIRCTSVSACVSPCTASSKQWCSRGGAGVDLLTRFI
jgi:hypothetical protein